MTDPTSHIDPSGALALLREAMRASPVPPAEILAFAVDACAAAGFPPTTPELDEKLRALGLLFGKAAPNSADLTHYLWHILEGNVPRVLALQALEAVQECEFKGVAGVMTRNALEAARDDLGSIYGGEMLKNLGALLKSIARRAVEMTTSGMEGEVAAARSERIAAVQTIKALEADLTKIAKAYYGEEAPTGVSADGIADFIGEVMADRNIACEGETAALLKAREANDRANEVWDQIGRLRENLRRRPIAPDADMARIRDLLHDRRARLALRDGEALGYPELVLGLLDDFYTAEHDLELVRGKGPSAADELRARWEAGVSAPHRPGDPLFNPATLVGAVGYPPPMQHPGVLALTINTPDSLTGARPSLALWYRLGDSTWCLAQQQIEPMRWGDTFLLTIPLGPK